MKNTSAAPVAVELAGWLENAVCLDTGKPGAGSRKNEIRREPGLIFLDCAAEPFGDAPRGRAARLDRQHDFGTMGLALLEPREGDRGIPSIAVGSTAEEVFDVAASATKPFGRKLVGAIVCRWALEPGQEQMATFVVTWHFPNLSLAGTRLPADLGRHYASRFRSAADVARHVARDFASLHAQTRLWHRTWYDATLPYWFLDRTFANTSILATSTCHRFRDGRFYGWEGVGCCAGTCTHVWHYAQAMARLFPELERIMRERVDYAEGIAFDPQTGIISHRAEEPVGPAVDGQAGTILRAYREHQMSADQAFLHRNWPKIKKSLEYLIRRDGNSDGILEGPQHNTLDAEWFGKVPWLSSLYLAALRAGEAMAREMGDDAVRPAGPSDRRPRRDQPRRPALERAVRIFRPAPRPGEAGRGRLVRRLPRRSSLRPALGPPGQPGHDREPAARRGGAPVAVELQLHARRRPLPPGP